MVVQGSVLWSPSTAGRDSSQIANYMQWLRSSGRVDADTYEALWAWSVENLEDFWVSVSDYFGVTFEERYPEVVSYTDVQHAHWFARSTLNYAQNVFDRGPAEPDATAIIGHSQSRDRTELSWSDLASEVARIRSGLIALGVGVGDRVAAYAPNIPEAVIAFLACASLGAIWGCCPVEFGVDRVVDRLRQVTPKVLFVVNGYMYGERHIDRQQELEEIRRAVPSCRTVIWIPYLGDTSPVPEALSWPEFGSKDAALTFTAVPFEHPLWILFSSGTTGLPKAIVHSHGGIVLEHLKYHGLQRDIGSKSRVFWYTTTGWMMWNLLVSALLVGASLVLFDGDPMVPDGMEGWRIAESERVTDVGFGAALIMQYEKLGLSPGSELDLSRLRGVGSTGSPLPIAGYEWVYNSVGSDLLLSSGSGGTDVCTGFVGSAPIVPVYAGEMSCKLLGCRVEVFNGQGESVVGEQGELVVTKPMPSMPVALWGDPTGQRLHETYFSTYPGIWRHGDQMTLTSRGSAIITGRSDATLNRGGVRIGTSEIYPVVESVEGIEDSLIIHIEADEKHRGEIVLFVVIRSGWTLTEEMEGNIRHALTTKRSPRHVPDRVIAVPNIPRTLTGKKLEVPVKRILQGQATSVVAQPDAMADPGSLGAFESFATSSEWLAGRSDDQSS
jgi:acetoacetyl-CoA synthetase